jgi:hypothetical protein
MNWVFDETTGKMRLEAVGSKSMNIETPSGLRKGQTIFNFLSWLKGTKPELTINSHSDSHALRMANPFYIEDEKLDILFEEFLAQYKSANQ